MTPFLLSQILIGFAICFDMFSFQFKDRNKIVFCLFCSAILISSHFILLEQYTAAGLTAIAAVRFIISIYSTSKKFMFVFLATSFIVTFITYSGVLSILSYLGASVNTVASFCKEDKHLRIIMIVGTLFWILHNYLANTPAAMLMELLFLSSNLVGYYRHYIRPVKIKIKADNN